MASLTSWRAETNRQRIVQLVWLYFALLVLEGALRKWVLPSFSDVLLLVRDPLAIAIIYLGHRDGYFRIDGLVRSFIGLAIAFTVLAALQIAIYGVPPVVVAFGLRSYFLHPPVIFIMARVLSARDLRRFLVVTIVAAVPIALLMVEQFQAGPLDWVNRGVGERGLQILSALGKIRPAGPFSYISGPVFYFSLTLACLIASHLNRIKAPLVVQMGGWAALLVAAAVSGSRALVFGLIPVFVAVAIALVKRPRLVGGFVRGAVTATVIVMVVWGSTAVQEGLDVFNARMEAAGGTDAVLQRSNDMYLYSATALNEAPLLGLGIGLGTNAANGYLGAGYFRFGENEWNRVLLEAGPILGGAYLAWRVWLTLWLFAAALRAVSLGEVLPIVLLGAALTNLLIGPWGQPTTQGFAVICSGLCLAGCRVAQLHAMRVRRLVALRMLQGREIGPVVGLSPLIGNPSP